MQKADKEIEYPPVGCAEYILKIMREIGYPSPEKGYVEHGEIRAHGLATGQVLMPDEHNLVFDLFVEYSASKAKFERNELEPQPFTTKTDEEVKMDKNNSFKAVLMSLAESQDKKYGR